MDVRVTNIDPKTRKLGLSIKAREIAEEKEAVEQYGSSDSGASLGDRICLDSAIWACVVASLFWMVLMRSVARSNRNEVEIFMRVDFSEFAEWCQTNPWRFA